MSKLPLAISLFISILLTTSAIAQVPTDQDGDFSFTLSLPTTKKPATGNTSIRLLSRPLIWQAPQNR
jgi:hypothetical protein